MGKIASRSAAFALRGIRITRVIDAFLRTMMYKSKIAAS